ncbi:hypothetical protein GF420_01915 [candidate division GN15 bacterium]|nr:hypothetical protein [candidate division GN15 bacterium]
MSADQKLKDQLAGLVAAPLQAEDCELADIVLSRYKSSVTLRFFVYCQGGVSLDMCARLSRAIGDLIDRTDWFERGYTLEVSSPGLDRPLSTEQDFRYRVGETVKVLFADPKRKKVTAEIAAVSDGQVTFTQGEEEFTVPLTEISKATIVF